MVFPANLIVVSHSKVRDYLLKPLSNDDKSNYISLGGYSRDNWEELLKDIIEYLSTKNAELIDKTSYGDKYLIQGILHGRRDGRSLYVDSIWQKDKFDEFYRFITLYPSRLKGALV